jgi:hypothetical protein
MKKHGRVALVFMMAVVIGFLLPGVGIAGSLEPSGPPGPTMRTLDEIYNTNSWSKKLPCDSQTNCPRFEVLADFNNEAVLDKETGLVWEKSPSNLDWQGVWLNAKNFCNEKRTGGSLGWRLPSVQELASLVDPLIASPGPAIPPGSPFDNIQSYRYWSSTLTLTKVDLTNGYVNPYFAYAVDFSSGAVETRGSIENCKVWCVRGGSGVDAQ